MPLGFLSIEILVVEVCYGTVLAGLTKSGQVPMGIKRPSPK